MGVNSETGLFDPLETRSADALVEMAATDGAGDGSATQLTVFTELEALLTQDRGWAELDNTAPISNAMAQWLGCDSIIETIITQGGQPIGIGRRSRKIPGWLRRLVEFRDGHQCQHPACTNTRWLQIHHIIAWAVGGPTDLDNLILLCGVHHRLIHAHDWHITGPPDKRVFRRKNWTPYPTPRRPLEPRLAELVSI
jgi:hypothetical protein